MRVEVRAIDKRTDVARQVDTEQVIVVGLTEGLHQRCIKSVLLLE